MSNGVNFMGSKIHEVKSVLIQDNIMEIDVDGKKHQIDISQISKLLSSASQDQKNNLEISPSGYGIHWPDIDEDLSIDGLLGKSHSYEIPPNKELAS